MKTFFKIEIFLLITFLVFACFSFGIIKAGTNENVSGWIWSDNIGWISLNNITDDGSSYNYGVNINPSTGLFSGYAWSDSVGWIDFSPSGFYPDIPNYSACLDFPGVVEICNGIGDHKAAGWARTVNTGDGWDGWIKLRDDVVYTDGVFLNNSTDELEGWAWSDDFGWISFNCITDGTCATSDYKAKYSPPNDPPVLNWTGEANYVSDGLNPEFGNDTTLFSYRIKYTDAEGDAPNFVRVHIKKGGGEILGSPFDMNCAIGDYTVGVNCFYITSLSVATDYTYYFEAQDGQGADALDFPDPEIDAPDVGNVPNTIIISNPPDPDNQTTAQFIFIGTGSPTSYECQLDSGGWYVCTSPENVSIAQGSHTLEVKAINIYGEDPSPASYTWLVDTTDPSVDSFDVNPKALNIYSPTATIDWTVSDTGGSHLDHVEIWRTPDAGGVPDGGGWQKIGSDYPAPVGSDNWSDSATDSPPYGDWWYGLRVFDLVGNWGIEPDPPGSIQVTKDQPPTCTSLSTLPTTGGTPLDVSFTGEGSDPDGIIVQYEFDFGEGPPFITPNNTADHIYNSAGTYCAKLRVQDDEGVWSVTPGDCPDVCAEEIVVEVNNPPTAIFSCQILDCMGGGCVCDAVNWVTYNGEGVFYQINNGSIDAENNIVRSTWSIVGWQDPFFDCPPGDILCSMPIPIIPEGNYTVKLEVEDAYNLTDTITHPITIEQDAIADFKCSLYSGGPWSDCDGFGFSEGEMIYFNSEDYSSPSEPGSGTSIISWSWTFIDGTPPTGNLQNSSSIFEALSSNSGEITLTITDTAGRSKTTDTYKLIIKLPLPEWREVSPF